MRHRSVTKFASERLKPEVASNISRQFHEWLGRLGIEVNDSLFKLAYPRELVLEAICGGDQSLERVDVLFG
jgi:hypothetical protein